MSNNNMVHRLIMNVTSDNLKVDHINHDPSDNRRENLRIGTQQQNCQNKPKKAGTSSPYNGVTKTPIGNYQVTIRHNNAKVSNHRDFHK